MNAGTYSHASNYGGPVSQGHETGLGRPAWSAGAPPTPVRVDPVACAASVGVGRRNGLRFRESFSTVTATSLAGENEAKKDTPGRGGFLPESGA